MFSSARRRAGAAFWAASPTRRPHAVQCTPRVVSGSRAHTRRLHSQEQACPAPSPPGSRGTPALYERNARFVSDLGAPVLELLAPQPGEHVLDLGCGDGALTERIAASGAVVRGCDASAELLTAARARGLQVDWADGHALPYDAEFDAVFSNAALHWMTRPADVAAGVKRALRYRAAASSGSSAASATWRPSVAALIAALESRGIDGAAAKPWYFPTAKEYATILEAAGFIAVNTWIVRVLRLCRPAWRAGCAPSPSRSCVTCPSPNVAV